MIGADRSRDVELREQATAGRVVAGNSATTDQVGNARSAYGSWSAAEAAPCTVLGIHQANSVVARETAGPV
jgi:hypothetical protein